MAIMPIKSNADKLVSQGTAGSQSSGGDTAQNTPATKAVGVPNKRRATYIIAATVSTANMVCSDIITAADVKV
jgi:hypothetical protein